MDIAVIGGGPAGLYFASLYQRDHPEARVRVFERNRPDDTFGFGVAFQEVTLRNLADADPESQSQLLELLQPWDNFFFHVRGTDQRISDLVFAGCSRRKLLELLQQRAESLGVELHFERAVVPEDFSDADLIVVADGSGSRTRTRWADHFGATVEERPNRFVWLGTTLKMDALNFFFNEQPEGLFVAHSYPHAADQGTWIVEVTDETFARLGIDEADEEATVRLVTRVFADELQGHPVIARGSFWRRFPLVTCTSWSRGNVVLLGDAKGTVHFSIGSGTKIAMEDAVALHRALKGERTVLQALANYEAERRPAFNQLRAMAYGSMLWFEQLDDHWKMDPSQIIFSAATRKTTETYDTLQARVPELVAAAAGAVASDHGPGEGVTSSPFGLAAIQLSNRVVATFDQATVDGVPPADLVLVGQFLPAPRGGTAEVACDAEVGASIASLVEQIGSGHQGLVGLALSAEVLANVCTGDAVDPIAVEQFLVDIGHVATAAAGSPIAILVLDLSAWEVGEGAGHTGAQERIRDLACATILRLRAHWPAQRLIGARISCPVQPVDALPVVASLIRAGCAVVDVSGSGNKAGLFDRQVLLADLIRTRLGTPTICGGLLSRDDADTVLASGRADLVRFAS